MKEGRGCKEGMEVVVVVVVVVGRGDGGRG